MNTKEQMLYQNKILEYAEHIRNAEYLYEELVRDYGTDKRCPHCGAQLFKSDLPAYKYLCIECDENFYGVEIE